MNGRNQSIKNDVLPWAYTVEGKTVHFSVKGASEKLTVCFQSIEARNRELPEFINVLFAVATHYRSRRNGRT